MNTFSIVGDRKRVVKESLLHFDYALAIVTLAVAVLGVLMVYTATREKLIVAGLSPKYYLERQAIWVLLGFVVMVVAVFIDYRHIRNIGYVIYGAVVLGLLGVLTPVGKRALGAQRWFQLGPLQLQPSEFASLAVIVAVAVYLAGVNDALPLRKLIGVLALVGVPMILVVKQPDIGTTLIIGFVLLAQLVVARVRLPHLAVLGAIGAVGIFAIIHLGILQSYQLARLTSFVNPHASYSGSGYNLAQSKIAIGAGGVFGKGLFHGTQTNLAYVPEQQTDFIFTAVGEQLGFVGAGGLLIAFGFICWRVWRVASIARDPLGKLLSSGVLALLVFSIFQNVAMTIGIMPITGIPLPFMSYGGSAAISFFVAIGLALGIGMRNSRYLPEDRRDFGSQRYVS